MHKHQIFLIDESLTVQKVVALSLDKEKYELHLAKSKQEALRILKDKKMDVILVSDQLLDVGASSFPREVELMLAGTRKLEPIVLLTSQDLAEVKNYQRVLRKPFSPQYLQEMIGELCAKDVVSTHKLDMNTIDLEEENLHQTFQKNFANEAELVAETFQIFEGESKPKFPVDELLKEVGHSGEGVEMDKMIEKVLDRILPPIVEKVVRQRLDELLKEQEKFVDLR